MGRKFSHFFHKLFLVLVSASPSQQVFPSISFTSAGGNRHTWCGKPNY